MSKKSISIQTFVDFTKVLLAEDPRYKDFNEVAKFIIKRPGQTEAGKMVALKGLAKIYEQLAKKDTSFSFSEDDAKIIDVDLEKDNLENQFKRIAISYSVKGAEALSVDSIKARIDKLTDLSPLAASEEVVSLIKDIHTLSQTNFLKNRKDQIICINLLLDEAVIFLHLNPNFADEQDLNKSLCHMLLQKKVEFAERWEQHRKLLELLPGSPEEKEKYYDELHKELGFGLDVPEPEDPTDYLI